MTSNIKRMAQETMVTPQQILSKELRNVNDDVPANLPTIETIRRNIRKVRERNDLPPNPLNRQDS
uniref:Putative LOC100575364 [Acyrthosiphon pisum] n=1 Tax=Lepeophtheirus salmonis TaxID=72036 RepID=A0A0K2UJ62_LEPSM